MTSLFLALSLAALPLAAEKGKKETERLENCGTVLKEILNIPDDIPIDLLNQAECVIVIPTVIKFAMGVSGNAGKGAMVCRGGQHYTGPWGPPAMMRLEGLGIGFQLGGQATDFVLLIMNPQGAESMMKSKVKLGVDAAASAGPKGRDAAAASDIAMRAEILSYSRSRGLFAGVSLEGSTLRQDNMANAKIYGRRLTALEIIRKGGVGVPASGRTLVNLLNQKSPKNMSDPESLK